jgi:hypothetical protein
MTKAPESSVHVPEANKLGLLINNDTLGAFEPNGKPFQSRTCSCRLEHVPLADICCCAGNKQILIPQPAQCA